MSYIGPMYFLYKQVFFSFTKLDFTQYHLHDKNKMCFMKLWSKYSFYKRLFPVFSKMYRSALQYMNKHNIYTIYAAVNYRGGYIKMKCNSLSTKISKQEVSHLLRYDRE